MREEYRPCFVSFIDQSNTPILIHVAAPFNDDVNNNLKFNVLSNMSLDYFESQLFEWSSLPKNRDIKMLFNVDDVKVYGMLVKQTGLKIMVGFPQSINDDEAEIEAVFTKIRKIYVRTKCNPFLSTNASRHEFPNLLNEKLSSEL